MLKSYVKFRNKVLFLFAYCIVLETLLDLT